MGITSKGKHYIFSQITFKIEIMRHLLLFILVISVFSCNNKTNTQQSKKIIEQKIENKIVIPNGFIPVYKISKQENYSFPNMKRTQQRIILPADLSKEDVLNNLRKCCIELYKQQAQSISILAFNKESEVNSSYTIAKYDFCPDGDWSKNNTNVSVDSYKENYHILDTYFAPKPKIYSKGDIVLLKRDKEWSLKEQNFIPATTTPISKNPRNFSEENIIKEVKNNQEAQITDIFEETMTGGHIWRVYKITIKKNKLDGWVDEANIIPIKTDQN